MIQVLLTKYWKYFLVLLLMISSFGLGYYKMPSKVETKTVTVTVEKLVQEVKQNTKQVAVIKKDGTEVITTDINTDTNTEDDTSIKEDTTKIVTRDSGISISALAGFDLNGVTPIYGGSVSKQVLGPIEFGIWGLTSKTVGISIGAHF